MIIKWVLEISIAVMLKPQMHILTSSTLNGKPSPYIYIGYPPFNPTELWLSEFTIKGNVIG